MNHGNSPTVSSALLDGESRLEASGFVLRPRRHAELLLETALGVDRTALYLNAKDTLPPEVAKSYERLLNRRLSGEPVQHIVGWAPFYGRRFLVSKGVFIPRFDTEVIIEIVLEHLVRSHAAELEILDLCCGCGAIGLTLAAELPNARVTLADNDLTALKSSNNNAIILGVEDRTGVVEIDVLEAAPDEWVGRFDIVAANPPYISLNDLAALHPDVRDGEPRSALTDNSDGLSFYRRWRETLPLVLKPGGLFVTEFGDNQAHDVVIIFDGLFSQSAVRCDLSGNPRAFLGFVRSDLSGHISASAIRSPN